MIISAIKKTLRHNFLPENRFNTIIELVAVFVWMFSAFIYYRVISVLVPELGFLNLENTINIIATFFIADGLIYSLLFRNLHDLGVVIENKKFNQYLLLPTDTIKFISHRKIQFSSMIQIPFAILMLLFFGNIQNVGILIFWLFSLILGFLIAKNLWLLLSYVSFWVKVGTYTSTLFEELSAIGQFPLRFFVNSGYLGLFFPFLMISSGTSELLLVGLDLKIILWQLILLFSILISNKVIVNLGISHYRKG